MEALKQYIRAIEVYKAGDTSKAESLLAQSIGQDHLPSIMKQNLAKMLDSNDAVLTLVLKEIADGDRRIQMPS